MTDLQLATSRYGASDLIAASGLVPVGITVGSPRRRLGFELAGNVGALAPHGLLEVEDPEEFERRYRERLDRFGPVRIEAVLSDFARAHETPSCVLLFFERAGDPCHRRLFAAWWEEQTGRTVPELERPFRQPTLG